MTWCDRCDLDRSMCEHGLADRSHLQRREATVLVSPRGMAHFRGCSHKGDDPDYEKWGELVQPDAWQQIGNGRALEAVDKSGRPLIATGRCSTCEDHGPWV